MTRQEIFKRLDVGIFPHVTRAPIAGFFEPDLLFSVDLGV